MYIYIGVKPLSCNIFKLKSFYFHNYLHCINNHTGMPSVAVVCSSVFLRRWDQLSLLYHDQWTEQSQHLLLLSPLEVLIHVWIIMNPLSKNMGHLQSSTLPVQQLQRMVQALLKLGWGSMVQEVTPISRVQGSALLSKTGRSCRMRHRLISCLPWARMKLRSYDAVHLRSYS